MIYIMRCFIDFVHVATIFLVSNDKAVSKIQKTRGEKFHSLCFKNYYVNSVMPHDAEKDFFLIFQVIF